MKTHLLRRLSLASTAVAMSMGCAAGTLPDGTALVAEIGRLIGDASCHSDDQCRTLAFGAKACGGPQSYLAWSTLRTDEVALKAAASRYAALQRDATKSNGRVSNCAFVSDPGAHCAKTAATATVGAEGLALACHLKSGPGGDDR